VGDPVVPAREYVSLYDNGELMLIRTKDSLPNGLVVTAVQRGVRRDAMVLAMDIVDRNGERIYLLGPV
jgi:hypothetical protein